MLWEITRFNPWRTSGKVIVFLNQEILGEEFEILAKRIREELARTEAKRCWRAQLIERGNNVYRVAFCETLYHTLAGWSSVRHVVVAGLIYDINSFEEIVFTTSTSNS